MSIRKAATIGFVMVLFAGCATKQTAQPTAGQDDTLKSAPSQTAQNYLSSPRYREMLLALGKRWDTDILGLKLTCSGPYAITDAGAGIIEPLVFAAEAVHPEEGVWIARYELARCGKSIVYNVMIAAREGKRPKMAPLVPGTTSASPRLIYDLYRQAVPLMVTMKSESATCEQMVVSDTRVSMKPTTLEVGGKKYSGVWEEQWTVKHCNEDIDITLCLVPDGQGGTAWHSRACDA